jgi:hypothetical protein
MYSELVLKQLVMALQLADTRLLYVQEHRACCMVIGLI